MQFILATTAADQRNGKRFSLCIAKVRCTRSRTQPHAGSRVACVLLSDLLWNADPGQAVRQLADRALRPAIVLQVLATSDANPPVGGYLRLLDSETDEVREVH